MTAIDLINLSAAAVLRNDITNRVRIVKDVPYDHLGVFGCRVFVLIPKDDRSKLYNKAKQCIFISYGNKEFGYRLWNP